MSRHGTIEGVMDCQVEVRVKENGYFDPSVLLFARDLHTKREVEVELFMVEAEEFQASVNAALNECRRVVNEFRAANGFTPDDGPGEADQGEPSGDTQEKP